MPGFLAEVDLERVIGSVTRVILVTSCLARVVGIRLEKVDGIARSGLSGARGEVSAANQVAEIRRATRQDAGKLTGSAVVEISNKVAIGKEGCSLLQQRRS